MAVIGAVLGDIAGSQFEFERSNFLDWKNCDLFGPKCCFTDDTVMTLSIKKALDSGISYAEAMHEIGKKYSNCGYGGRFYYWINNQESKAYGSYGNGSAMRVSYVADYFDDLADVQNAAKRSAEVTHNHPEGIKGAVVTATCIWMAKNGKSRQEIYDYVLLQYPESVYECNIARDLESYRKNYVWNETCQGSVAPAMRCFYESDSYESFLRNVYSFKCDSDTLAAIGGGVAEEFYHGVGFDADEVLKKYLDDRLYGIITNSTWNKSSKNSSTQVLN